MFINVNTYVCTIVHKYHWVRLADADVVKIMNEKIYHIFVLFEV